ncbi:Heptaprenyl diphosphate synthase component 2 [bioreactor metagenome]|uniref:Heptaprenyl diphosphate synthase component 2 n=1 Tax=bioreactor metagenome TaxID=1076179 RepID=A0A644ZL68_9ZZZZ
MAFQIIDDVLDYVGDESKVGKPLGGDLRQGLITLPVLYYIQNHLENPSIIRLLDGKCITEDEEITSLVKEIAVSDAIGKSLNDAHDLVLQAQSCLVSFPESQEKQTLLALTEYIIERNK